MRRSADGDADDGGARASDALPDAGAHAVSDDGADAKAEHVANAGADDAPERVAFPSPVGVADPSAYRLRGERRRRVVVVRAVRDDAAKKFAMLSKCCMQGQ